MTLSGQRHERAQRVMVHPFFTKVASSKVECWTAVGRSVNSSDAISWSRTSTDTRWIFADLLLRTHHAGMPLRPTASHSTVAPLGGGRSMRSTVFDPQTLRPSGLDRRECVRSSLRVSGHSAGSGAFFVVFTSQECSQSGQKYVQTV